MERSKGKVSHSRRIFFCIFSENNFEKLHPCEIRSSYITYSYSINYVSCGSRLLANEITFRCILFSCLDQRKPLDLSCFFNRFRERKWQAMGPVEETKKLNIRNWTYPKHGMKWARQLYIGKHKCGNINILMSRNGARTLLRWGLSSESDVLNKFADPWDQRLNFLS